MRNIKRLLSDWMLVQLEPERGQTIGGIVLPGTTAEPVRTGTVLETGPGRRYIDKFSPMPDLIGKRVAFMIGASHTSQGEEIRKRLELPEDKELIRLGDVLLELDPGVEVGR